MFRHAGSLFSADVHRSHHHYHDDRSRSHHDDVEVHLDDVGKLCLRPGWRADPGRLPG
jgi:hypothetical protein